MNYCMEICVRKTKEIFRARYTVSGSIIFLEGCKFGHLFYYILYVPIIDICHIVLPFGSLLLGYFKFSMGILLEF